MSIHAVDKPDTLQQKGLREWIKVRFLSNHLRSFPRHEKTLDIGCGWGFSRLINPDFYFVDADKDCIDFLKQEGANAYLVDVAEQLPFQEGYFDNAFTHDVLEHLDQDQCLSLFKEASRVIKSGGIFMNIVPNYKGYVMGLNPEVGHKRFVTEKEIIEAGAATGFRFVKKWHTPLPAWMGQFFAHNKLVCVLVKI